MRVLYLVDRFWPYLGGIETVTAALLPELQRRGHEVTVVTDDSEGRLPAHDWFRGVPIRRLNIIAPARRGQIAQIRQAQEAVSELRRLTRPDVVHCALGGAMTWYAAPRQDPDQPVLLSCHGPWPRRHPITEAGLRGAVQRADWVTACSESTLAWLMREWHADPARTSVIANGLDPPAGTPTPPTLSPPVLLCVARLSPEKGLDLALAALASIRQRVPTARLLIAGDGPERASLEGRAAALGLSQAVEFLGWVAPPEIPALLGRASIALVPSRSEGFGLVALEAAFARRPIVATAVGGLAENLRHRQTALLVPPEDPGALSDAVLELVAAPDRAARLAEAARQTAMKHWTAARYADRCEELYERLQPPRPRFDRTQLRRLRQVPAARALIRGYRQWRPRVPEVSMETLLPTPQLTMFLRAALLDGEPARMALHAWLDGLGGSTANLRRRELAPPSLLPLLGDGVRRNGWELPPRLRSLLRAAAARETVRAEYAAAACRDVLSALEGAGTPTIVLRGVTLAHTAYPRIGLRHCHDLDLLVRREDVERTHDVLAARGGCIRASGRLVHRSNFPIELHTRPTATDDSAVKDLWESSVKDLWESSVRTTLAGAPARVLDPCDELLALCAHAAATPGRSPQWAADATMLLRAAPPDWGAAVERAGQLRASGPASLLLGWLKEQLSAPVPEWAIRELATAAERADEREARGDESLTAQVS